MIHIGLKIEINQINAVDVNNILDRQEELTEVINKTIEEKSLDLFLVIVTDIVECDSYMIAIGNRLDIAEKAFDVKLEDNKAFLKGVVSRKKQVVPNIEKALG